MSDTEIGALEIDEVRDDLYFLYAGSTEAGHFYFAVEGDFNWELRLELENAFVVDLAAARENPDMGEILLAAQRRQGSLDCPVILLRSTDFGNEWIDFSDGVIDPAVNVVSVDPHRIFEHGYHVGTSSAYYLKSGSEPFEEQNVGWSKIVLAGAARHENRMVSIVWNPYFDEPGSIAGSTDGGNTWRIEYEENGRLIGGDVAILATEPPIALASGNGMPCRRESLAVVYRDDGTGWLPALLRPEAAASILTLVVDLCNEPTVFGGGTSGFNVPWIVRSTDSGVNWEELVGGLPSPGTVRSVAVSPLRQGTLAETLYAAVDGQGVYKTTNGGNNWFKPYATGLPTSVKTVAVRFDQTSIIFAGTLNGLYRSYDAGQTWSQLTGIPQTEVRSIAVHPITPQVFYVLTGAGRVYRSLNNGDSFTDITGTLPAGGRKIVLDTETPNTVYVAGSSGIFHTPHLWSGPIFRDARWKANEQISTVDVLTLPTNRSLVVEAGAVITATNRAGELRLYGSCSASGAIFTSTAISMTGWRGITVRSPNTNIDNCTILNAWMGLWYDAQPPKLRGSHISNCVYGIYLRGQILHDPVNSWLDHTRIDGCGDGLLVHFGGGELGQQIEYNTIVDNARDGVWLGGCRPVFYNNTVMGNDRSGVNCAYQGNAEFGINDASVGRPGLNVIKNNTWGGNSEVYVRHSSPFFGLAAGNCAPIAGGYNTISNDDTSVCRIYAWDTSYVLAHLTDWGGDTIRPSWIYADPSSYVDYRCPWIRRKEGVQDLIRQALALRAVHDYSGAINLYRQIVVNNGFDPLAQTAIVQLTETYKDYFRAVCDSSLRSTLMTYLQAQSRNHPSREIRHLSGTLIAEEYRIRGQDQLAVSAYCNMLNENLSYFVRGVVLSSLADLYASKLSDFRMADQMIQRMETEVPGHPLTEIARLVRALYSGQTPSSFPFMKSGRGTKLSTASQAPLRFALMQNYPNPFNPTTTIGYALPLESAVTLRVFNVLGQQVATLVNIVQAAGQYETLWDARAASSGVYYVRIDAVPTNGASLFTQVNKILLIK
jgi:photosystem II stability/assembly factor-like uncharacterized protein